MKLKDLIEALQARLDASFDKDIKVVFADNSDNYEAVSVYQDDFEGTVYVDIELSNEV